LKGKAFVSPYFAPFAGLPTAGYDAATLTKCLVGQIEYYFSEENLQRDFFLRRKMDAGGYLPIGLIGSFHRIQSLTEDLSLLMNALRLSGQVEMNEEETKVRPKVGPERWPIVEENTSRGREEDKSPSRSGAGSRSDLHPDVPDFVPGKPYGNGLSAMYDSPSDGYAPDGSDADNEADFDGDCKSN